MVNSSEGGVGGGYNRNERGDKVGCSDRMSKTQGKRGGVEGAKKVVAATQSEAVEREVFGSV